MKPLLIEPTDVLFFRDAIPMSAGQGRGAGCRLPFPSTLHEAFRSSLLRASGELAGGKRVEGRPRDAVRQGNWHAAGHDGKTFIATKAYRSLRTVGPLPWTGDTGLHLPVPLDVARAGDGTLARLNLWRDPDAPVQQAWPAPDHFRPLCLPLATTPPDKRGQLHGWWSTAQMQDYLRGLTTRPAGDFQAIPSSALWSAEHRVGIQIDPGSFASADGQLYAGSYLRANRATRFVAWTEIADPARATNGEAAARTRERQQLADLDWLLLGGEFRLARLWATRDGQPLADPLGELRSPPPALSTDGPCLLKWVLVTPAIFAHGSLPGWCVDTRSDRAGGVLPVGRVCLELPGSAHLVSWCLGRPRAVSGFDVVAGQAKPTQLAVPEGSVYYFLCQDRATATALARALHWRPRSDFHGEKGCGYGLVSFHATTHRTSPDVLAMATELFNR